jgi:hypothetical protein
VHAEQGGAAVLLGIFPAALALGLLYRGTGSLLGPFVAHAALDAATFLRIGSNASGQSLTTEGILVLVSLVALAAGWRRILAALHFAAALARHLAIRESALAAAAAVGLAAAALLPATWLAAAGDGAAGLLLAALLLVALALALHRFRGLPVAADHPRLDVAPPGLAAGCGQPGRC